MNRLHHCDEAQVRSLGTAADLWGIANRGDWLRGGLGRLRCWGGGGCVHGARPLWEELPSNGFRCRSSGEARVGVTCYPQTPCHISRCFQGSTNILVPRLQQSSFSGHFPTCLACWLPSTSWCGLSSSGCKLPSAALRPRVQNQVLR